MDAFTVNVFANAVVHVFDSWLKQEVRVGRPSLKMDQQASHDVSAILNLCGPLQGVIALGCSRAVADQLYAQGTGQQADQADEAAYGALFAELLRRIAEHAQTLMTELEASVGCPAVVLGEGFRILRTRDIPSITLPCACGPGEFLVEIGIKPQPRPR